MRAGFVFLALAYILSQFYRAFLAVLTPVLDTDLGATAADLSVASGLWFGVFAAMQIPVGWALDRFGPRWTAASLLALGGGGGTILFATAQSATSVQIAMGLIGVGCSPILMASYYIFAHLYRPALFGTLAGVILGVGAAGNLAGSVPLAMAVDSFGWRNSLWGMFALTLFVAGGLAMFVKNPRIEQAETTPKGSLLDVIKTPALWLISPLLFVNYVPAAAIRGLWAGPYLRDVFGLDAAGIGNITFWMAVAMMVGSFAYGPLDRLFRTRKLVVLVGNFLVVLCLLGLWLHGAGGLTGAALLLVGVGLFGMSSPVLTAHGRAFFPKHLIGRGMTLLNLFSIGGAGIFQIITGRVYTAVNTVAAPAHAYQVLFLFFALILLAGMAVYLFSEDRLD